MRRWCCCGATRRRTAASHSLGPASRRLSPRRGLAHRCSVPGCKTPGCAAWKHAGGAHVAEVGDEGDHLRRRRHDGIAPREPLELLRGLPVCLNFHCQPTNHITKKQQYMERKSTCVVPWLHIVGDHVHIGTPYWHGHGRSKTDF